MQCPFCQQDMKAIDNGKAPKLAMVWVCRKCPKEVRVMAEKNVETEVWTATHMSIFVEHKEKEFCLHWDYVNKSFDIRDTAKSSGRDSYIFKTAVMPTTVTPTNALDKLQIYLIFS